MTAKNKIIKKQKLRNAEYYDFQGVQDKLYEQSKRGKIFKNLVQIITLEENIKLAYRNIKKNTGSYTAGVDNQSEPKENLSVDEFKTNTNTQTNKKKAVLKTEAKHNEQA